MFGCCFYRNIWSLNPKEILKSNLFEFNQEAETRHNHFFPGYSMLWTHMHQATRSRHIPYCLLCWSMSATITQQLLSVNEFCPNFTLWQVALRREEVLKTPVSLHQDHVFNDPNEGFFISTEKLWVQFQHELKPWRFWTIFYNFGVFSWVHQPHWET